MTDPDREAELRSLIRYAKGLGLCETTVLIVYEAVVADDRIARADRQAEVRRRLLMAVRQGPECKNPAPAEPGGAEGG